MWEQGRSSNEIKSYNHSDATYISEIFKCANAYLAYLSEDNSDLTVETNKIAKYVVRQLNVSADEVAFVASVLSPSGKDLVTKKEIVALSKIQDGSAPNSTDFKTALLNLVREKKILHIDYIKKYFKDELVRNSLTLETYISINYPQSVVKIMGDFVSDGNTQCNQSTWENRILDEHQHRPFPIINLAAELGDENGKTTFGKLKRPGIGSFVLWTDYLVWSKKDIKIDDHKKKRIENCVELHGKGNILVHDLFHAAFAGIIPEEQFEFISSDASSYFANLALQQCQIQSYEVSNDRKWLIRRKNKVVNQEDDELPPYIRRMKGM